MRRFFSNSRNISGRSIIINDKEQVHHIKDVLRLVPGDKVIVFDEKGREYSSIIEKISPAGVLFRIKKMQKSSSCRGSRLVIACAIPKGQKMDDIVDKLSQLGVDRLVPLLTERVVVRLDEPKQILRKARWEKIALSSAKQSQRNTVMTVDSIKDMEGALSQAQNFDLKLIPHLTGKRRTLKEIFNRCRPKNILVFIGPEGDFSPAELKLARQAGCIPVSLGELVLRVDTAAISVASFIRLYENN